MKTLKNLLLAVVNATLILVALCLFLLWQVSSTTERVAGNFAANLTVLEPVTNSIQDLNTQVAALRGDLDALMAGSGDIAAQGALQVQARIDQLGAKIDGLQTTLNRIADTPDRLMSTAVSATLNKTADTLTDLRGCQKPEA